MTKSSKASGEIATVLSRESSGTYIIKIDGDAKEEPQRRSKRYSVPKIEAIQRRFQYSYNTKLFCRDFEIKSRNILKKYYSV